MKNVRFYRRILNSSLILIIFSISLGLRAEISTAPCKECETQIKFAKAAQDKIEKMMKKGHEKVKRGLPNKPCTPICSFADPLSPAEMENLAKAYKTTQDVMLGAWSEMKRREAARRYAKCNKDECLKK